MLKSSNADFQYSLYFSYFSQAKNLSQTGTHIASLVCKEKKQLILHFLHQLCSHQDVHSRSNWS